MSDRVSWLIIERGWKVVAADGTEVGAVDTVTGDETEDIFDGLAIATSAFGKPRYVPADQVGEITTGAVHLTLSSAEVEHLGEYLEPATSAEIEPESKGGVGESIRAEIRELEGDVAAPTSSHEHSVSLVRRIVLFFQRLRG